MAAREASAWSRSRTRGVQRQRSASLGAFRGVVRHDARWAAKQQSAQGDAPQQVRDRAARRRAAAATAGRARPVGRTTHTRRARGPVDRRDGRTSTPCQVRRGCRSARPHRPRRASRRTSRRADRSPRRRRPGSTRRRRRSPGGSRLRRCRAPASVRMTRVDRRAVPLERLGQAGRRPLEGVAAQPFLGGDKSHAPRHERPRHRGPRRPTRRSCFDGLENASVAETAART